MGRKKQTLSANYILSMTLKKDTSESKVDGCQWSILKGRRSYNLIAYIRNYHPD